MLEKNSGLVTVSSGFSNQSSYHTNGVRKGGYFVQLINVDNHRIPSGKVADFFQNFAKRELLSMKSDLAIALGDAGSSILSAAGDSLPEINLGQFSGEINKINQSNYGREIYNQIVTHPRLGSLTIEEPLVPASIRKRMGVSPKAVTSFSNSGRPGVNATITMDTGMSAKIVTKSGQGVKIDTDNILFHELAHVLIELNNEVDMSRSNLDWREDIEIKAAEYEGKYGGYQRDIGAKGEESYW